MLSKCVEEETIYKANNVQQKGVKAKCNDRGSSLMKFGNKRPMQNFRKDINPRKQ
jgi:hypothetical protein